MWRSLTTKQSLHEICEMEFDMEEAAALSILVLRIRKKKRKYWVHPIYSERFIKGKFHTLYSDLRGHPKKFFQYFRMNVPTFDNLLKLIGPLLTS